MAAGTTGYTQDFISKKEESMTNSLLYDLVSQVYMYAQTNEEAPKDQIFEAEKKVIEELAQKGNCVIVGRCSDYILQGMPNVLHIYIRAPYENRLENCISNFNMTKAKAQKMISEVDKARERYHWKYAGYGPEDNKDIILNSGSFGIDGSVDVLEAMIRRHFNLYIGL